MAEKFVSAQWKEEVKWSSTVTVQRVRGFLSCPSGPSGSTPWLQTETFPLVIFEQSSLLPLVSQSVAVRPPPLICG